MGCGEHYTERLLRDAALDELEPEDALRLEAALAAAPDLGPRLAELRATARVLADLAADGPLWAPDAGFAARITESVAANATVSAPAETARANSRLALPFVLTGLFYALVGLSLAVLLAKTPTSRAALFAAQAILSVGIGLCLNWLGLLIARRGRAALKLAAAGAAVCSILVLVSSAPLWRAKAHIAPGLAPAALLTLALTLAGFAPAIAALYADAAYGRRLVRTAPALRRSGSNTGGNT